MVERNITVLSKQEYDYVRIKYEEIINASVITNSDDAIDYVWNLYYIQKVPDIKRGKFLNRMISEDDIKYIIY